MIELDMPASSTTVIDKPSIRHPKRGCMIYLLLLLSLVSLACRGIIIDVPSRSRAVPSSTCTATQAKASTATRRSTATLRATPSPSATEQPVDTPTPTSTPQPTRSPTASLSPTPTIPTINAPGWEDLTVETLCLAIWDHYPQTMGSFSRADEIGTETRDLLANLGIQTVPLGEPCQAELTVILAFQALGTKYSDQEVLYTGASANGQLTLRAPEREQLVFPVSSLALFPSDSSPTDRQPVDPASAPYELVWREPLLSGLAQIWGEAVLFAGLEYEEWQADASNVLADPQYAPIQTRQPSTSEPNSSNSQLQVAHNPNPSKFIPGGISSREFTCYFQTTVEAAGAGIHIVTFGMDTVIDDDQVLDQAAASGPWSADEFADWYDCPGAFIPAGGACTDENNWLGSDKGVPFVGIWYYRGVDEQGKLVSGEAEIECVPE